MPLSKRKEAPLDPFKRALTLATRSIACDSTVEAACERICDRVSAEVSSAKSVSRMALSAALAFS